MRIAVSGTPGTGKTRLAKSFVKKGFVYVDLKKIKGISSGYDKKRKCRIIDIKKMVKKIIEMVEDNPKTSFVFDSHLSHYIPKKYIDLCIITKCSLKPLQKRLAKRGYSKKKIEENLQSEIFDICLNEAKEFGHKIKIVDTSKGISKSFLKNIG